MGRLKSLKVKICEDGVSAVLLEPYHAHVVGGGKIHVPKGFKTDFASVPRIFWRIVPPWGKYSPAAVVHDYLYFKGVDRAKADKTFLRLMGSLGVPGWKRYAMYYAVRMFGWPAWNEHRKRKGLGMKPTANKSLGRKPKK